MRQTLTLTPSVTNRNRFWVILSLSSIFSTSKMFTMYLMYWAVGEFSVDIKWFGKCKQVPSDVCCQILFGWLYIYTLFLHQRVRPVHVRSNPLLDTMYVCSVVGVQCFHGLWIEVAVNFIFRIFREIITVDCQMTHQPATNALLSNQSRHSAGRQAYSFVYYF